MVLDFEEWKKELHKEDIAEFGRVIDRTENHYLILYRCYRDHYGVTFFSCR